MHHISLTVLMERLLDLTDFYSSILLFTTNSCPDHNSSPFWSCASALGVVPFGCVVNFWLRMTDFGLKNCVFDVKLCPIHNSVPFWSWDFVFGHNVLQL